MKILYVCADRGIPLGGDKGASVHLRSITAALHRCGHEVTVLARNTSGDNPWPAVRGVESLAGEPHAAAAQITDALTEIGAHAVLERHSLESGPARRASANLGVPHILEVNAPLVSEAQRYRGLSDPNAAEREQAALRTADCIQVVSPALLRWVRSLAPDVPAVCIPNGADLAAFRTAPPTHVTGLGPGPVVGFVGSMKSWHGVADLLEAFALARTRIPDAGLLLVGGGPEEQDLHRRATAADLARAVVFTGPVTHDQVPGLVKRMTLAVAPYRPQPDFYFQPLKVVEYLAAGVPVVYSDQGDISDVVGPAGLAYPAGSVAGLAAGLIDLLTDSGRLADMAACAPGMASRSSWDGVANRVATLTMEIRHTRTGRRTLPVALESWRSRPGDPSSLTGSESRP